MPGPANAGLFVYAKDLERLAAFYQSLLAMTRLHATADLVVLESPDVQLVVHRIPPPRAEGLVVTTPPTPRENTALKFFFTVPGLDAARPAAAALGGEVLAQTWDGTGFRACNAIDPEGNVFQLRERTAPAAAAGTAAASAAATSTSIVGTWRVVSHETWQEDGGVTHAFGDDPVGLAVFDVAGMASIQIARRPPGGEAASALVEEDATAFASSYAGYLGPYVIDADGRGVSIHVQASNVPAYVGSVQHRPFVVDGDRLTLGIAGRYRALLERQR